MPQLSDLIKKRTTDKKFVKKTYRPWDLSGTGTTDPVETTDNNPDVIAHEKNTAHQSIQAVKNIFINETRPVITGNVSGNATDNKQATIGEQTDNIQTTGKKQPDNNQGTYRQQTDNELTNVLDNSEDIVFLSDTIRKLTGIQKQIFFYVIDLCSSRGLLDTGVMLTNELTTITNCSFGSVKTSLGRLINKKLVVRKKGKAARGGHIILGITKNIQAAALHAERFRINPRINILHSDNIIGNNLGNNQSYSSSNNINNNTTTKLSQEWDEIDISNLADIGFSKTQLLQLYSRELNVPQIVQESINHFAFALENNKKVMAYPDPLNVLMGVLRKGMSWHEKNYVSPKEKALKELLAFKKSEIERINQLEKSLIDEDFKLWRSTLDNNQKEQILDSKPRSNLISKTLTEKADEGHLLQHFKEHIYNKINI